MMTKPPCETCKKIRGELKRTGVETVRKVTVVAGKLNKKIVSPVINRVWKNVR